MKSIGLFLLVSVAAFGQHPGGVRSGGFNSNAYAHPNTFGSITGFGNVVFPGTGHAPVDQNLIPRSRPFAPGSGGGGGRFRNGGSFGSVVYVPYAVGVPAYGEFGQPPVTVIYPPQQQQMSPQVVINQNFTPETARPVVREYVQDASGGIRVYEPGRPVETPAPAAENPTYLVAFKDHTIYMALAYWVEGDTLHYVTNQNTHNQVSLDLVDRELSDRLNRERNVDFRLPPRK